MTIYNDITQNKRNSYLLMAVFMLVIMAIGWAFGQVMGSTATGMTIAFVFASVSALISYFYSDKIALSISHAQEVDLQSDRDLFHLMENLCIATGLPMPKLYIINDSAPNAFATGRDPQHAAICVTTGLLQKMEKRELEGVLAHELSHVKNYDTRMMTMVVVLVGVVALLSDWMLRFTMFGGSRRRSNRNGDDGGGLQVVFLLLGILLAILAPIIATLIKMAISRQREYLADASAALITRYPEGLASALQKIGGDPAPLKEANKATSHLYIANPLKDHKSSLNNLFDTHPPLEDRIARLRAM